MNTTTMLYNYRGRLEMLTPGFYIPFRGSVDYYKKHTFDDHYFKHIMVLANKEPMIGVSLV